MDADVRVVIDCIREYAYNYARLQEVKEDIESVCPKITATYGNLAGGSGGGVVNDKAARQGMRLYELDQKKLQHQFIVHKITRMINNSGLTEKEKALMWWIARNGKLQAFARRERIGKDNVYKIRDRAARKIIAANKPRNV